MNLSSAKDPDLLKVLSFEPGVGHNVPPVVSQFVWAFVISTFLVDATFFFFFFLRFLYTYNDVWIGLLPVIRWIVFHPDMSLMTTIGWVLNSVRCGDVTSSTNYNVAQW